MILEFATYFDEDNTKLDVYNTKDGGLYIELSLNNVECPFTITLSEYDKNELINYITKKP